MSKRKSNVGSSTGRKLESNVTTQPEVTEDRLTSIESVEHVTGQPGVMEQGTWIMYDDIDYGWMRGYIEKMPKIATPDRILVKFFEADDQELFTTNDHYARNGYLTHVSASECYLIPEDSYRMEEGFVLNMIDIALTSKDEELFTDLSHSLFYIQSQRG